VLFFGCGPSTSRAVHLFQMSSFVSQPLRQASARLAMAGKASEIHLQTRRFRCRNKDALGRSLRKGASRSSSEGARNHAPVRDRGLVGMLSVDCLKTTSKSARDHE